MKSILMVEDLPETRLWLAEVVRRAFPNCLISEAGTVKEGLELAAAAFDLVLIDLALPDGSGLEVLRQVRQDQPDALCVITTVMGEDALIIAALSAGAHGYILKEQAPDLLSRQLVQLAEGVPALSPSIAKRIMDHFRLTGPASAHSDTTLTVREKETLSIIARGFRNKEAAESLGIAPSTVACHIKSIYRKLGIATRAEASWHATRLGL